MADFVDTHKHEAEKLIKENKVQDLIFSEGTYQIKVDEYWPLLQVSDEGEIKDFLCGCKDSEKGCIHSAAAYLKIMQGQTPLHVLFKKSFFNELFKILAQRHGFTPEFFEKKEGVYEAFSKTKKKLLEIKPLDDQARKSLKQIIEKRVVETEENSLKFSNLTIEEMAAYKEGKPSFALSYELSFLKDLAKWLFIEKLEGKGFYVLFTEDEKNIPTHIKVTSSFIEMSFYIAETYLPEIIPTLSDIDSNLKVHEPAEDLIEKIVYENRSLRVIGREKQNESKLVGGIEIGPWIYKQGDGFYPKKPEPLLENPIIKYEKISEALSEYTPQIKKHLEGIEIHVEPVKLRYHLFFDSKSDLHITPYFFKLDDLEDKNGWVQYPWVYLPKKGFFPITESILNVRKIEREQVASFIDHHKGFLSDFPGFESHTTTLETKIIYQLDEKKNLNFYSRLLLEEGFGSVIDLGRYVYVKGEGFYQKTDKSPSFFEGKKMQVPQKEIASFIKTYLEDLKQIEGFFTNICPIEQMTLELRLKDGDQIEITPVIEYHPPYSPKNVFFFDPYLYVEGEGFYILPPGMQLPEKYRQKKLLSEEEQAFFLNFELESIRSSISYLDRRLRKPENLYLEISSISKSNRGWQVALSYVSAVGKENAFFVYNQIDEGKKFFFSNVGLLSLQDLRFSWIRRLEKDQIIGEHFIFSTIQWIYLCLFENILPPEGEAKKYFDELMSFETHEFMDLSLLRSQLRNYQESGVKWLWFLYCHDLSGLLCDEMGLGKTHQAMALLAAVLKKDDSKSKKYLVVCPTSVMYHWQNLLEKFLPSVRALLYYGPLRSIEDLKHYDILLTSYGILRSEKDELENVDFELAIFDEIQIAKTHTSITHKALRNIHTKMALGLTGTPLENRLIELKSLFDIVLPNYLPSEALFQREFVVPIEKNGDEDKKELLSKLVKPFILRRKKAEVLTELPEKTEEIAYCNLSEEQEKLYDLTLQEQSRQILQDLQDRDKPVPYMHVFSLFSKLKQICNHIALINKDIKHFQKYPSGKWDLFCELIAEANDSGQKVVVFSQYLDMLAMMGDYLDKNKIGYSEIKGSTKDRKEQVESFFNDPNKKVFLGSLLAAGVGIDLSCASVVIHYDRWWNAAKEDQATDRVHRIGQSRGVQVFKFVCKNTIEEHIHEMIKSKRQLLEETVGADDMDQIKLLTREELIQVLKRTKL